MSRQPASGSSTRQGKRGSAGRFFLRGLGVILPSVLTLWLLVTAYRFIDSNFAEPINAGVRFAISSAADQGALSGFEPTDAEIATEVELARKHRLDDSPSAARFQATRTNVDDWWAARWYLDLVGLVLAVVAVYTLGRLVGGFLGRRLLAAFEAGLLSVPGIRSIYPALKQVVEFLFGSEQKKFNFNRVVLVEYPRAGMWSMGLVTGDAPPMIEQAMAPVNTPTSGAANPQGAEASARGSLTVFMPNSPTPFTGWTITVPRDEVREVPLTIDEALRYLVSAGVIVPEAPANGGTSTTTPPPDDRS